MPPATQQHGESSLGGGLNSLDHCILYQLATHGAKASSATDVAAAAPEGPNPFDRNDGTTATMTATTTMMTTALLHRPFPAQR